MAIGIYAGAGGVKTVSGIYVGAGGVKTVSAVYVGAGSVKQVWPNLYDNQTSILSQGFTRYTGTSTSASSGTYTSISYSSVAASGKNDTGWAVRYVIQVDMSKINYLWIYNAHGYATWTFHASAGSSATTLPDSDTYKCSYAGINLGSSANQGNKVNYYWIVDCRSITATLYLKIGFYYTQKVYVDTTSGSDTDRYGYDIEVANVYAMQSTSTVSSGTNISSTMS